MEKAKSLPNVNIISQCNLYELLRHENMMVLSKGKRKQGGIRKACRVHCCRRRECEEHHSDKERNAEALTED